jgi:membrane fusion protein (multidrug efflux system)
MPIMAEADPTMPHADVSAQENSAPQTALRKKLFIGIGGAVLIAGLGFGAWHVFVGRHHVTTDNAYVGAYSASVTPMVSGQVATVIVSDTQAVHRGDVLVQIDDRDARIALAQAEANLVKAQRQFVQTGATGKALAAQVDARGAEIASAQAQLVSAQAAFQKAAVDLERRRKLAPSGAVSADELTSATNSFAAAKASLALAQAGVAQANSNKGAAFGNFSANEALITGTIMSTNPDVLAAQAKVDQAKLDLTRTVIRAPIDGVVTNRKVQVGQRLAAGDAVMTIVPVASLYVDANFKEGQLGQVKNGQPVDLVSDLYGSGVVYHGKVAGFSGGTGSSFALIPAQNATGNWIKVVQRLPVRVMLDPRELAAHPLRVGLSMDADINISGS